MAEYTIYGEEDFADRDWLSEVGPGTGWKDVHERARVARQYATHDETDAGTGMTAETIAFLHWYSGRYEADVAPAGPATMEQLLGSDAVFEAGRDRSFGQAPGPQNY